MQSDNIVEVGIDPKERLYIKPEKKDFPYIYRAAAEVNWDAKEKFLYSPKPREWRYIDWYKHILIVTKEEYGCELFLNGKTKWTNIPETLKEQIIQI